MESFCFNLTYQQTFILDYFNITCNDYNSTTKMLCYGTKEGSLLFSNTNGIEHFEDIKFINKNITDVPIYNVNWIDESKVGASFSDSVFVIYDINSEKLISFEDSSGTIRYIKKYDEQTFFTCGRNKCATAWDIRTSKTIKNLVHENPVTCIEYNSTNKNLLYTTSTPGTIVHFWDLRYTKKGVHFATKISISNSFCRELIFYRNNLYSKNILSSIYKTSQRATFKNTLITNNTPSYCGSISYNNRYDSIFTCINNDVFFVHKNKFNRVIIDKPNKLIGCICLQDHYIICNDAQNIYLYKLYPYLE